MTRTIHWCPRDVNEKYTRRDKDNDNGNDKDKMTKRPNMCHLISKNDMTQSKHLKGRSVPRFFNHKGFCGFPVSRHFPYSATLIWAPSERRSWITRDFVIFLFLDTFHIQKWLETGKRQIPLKNKSLFQGILSFLETGKRQNLLKKSLFKGFCRFYCF